MCIWKNCLLLGICIWRKHHLNFSFSKGSLWFCICGCNDTLIFCWLALILPVSCAIQRGKRDRDALADDINPIFGFFYLFKDRHERKVNWLIHPMRPRRPSAERAGQHASISALSSGLNEIKIFFKLIWCATQIHNELWAGWEPESCAMLNSREFDLVLIIFSIKSQGRETGDQRNGNVSAAIHHSSWQIFTLPSHTAEPNHSRIQNIVFHHWMH